MPNQQDDDDWLLRGSADVDDVTRYYDDWADRYDGDLVDWSYEAPDVAALIHQTVKTYGRMAFEYPYPKAVNVNGPQGGMEYPMLAFCGARPQPDGDQFGAKELSASPCCPT